MLVIPIPVIDAESIGNTNTDTFINTLMFNQNNYRHSAVTNRVGRSMHFVAVGHALAYSVTKSCTRDTR